MQLIDDRLQGHDRSDTEAERYARQISLPPVGIDGQDRLRRARVLCVGAGGLGSPLATYLTAAGVGTLGLVDFDSVALSNLHRQPLYATADVGRPKLTVASERLRALNPHVAIVEHPCVLDTENALTILTGYDVIADGTDNFAARYLVNDACVMLGKPNVYASVHRFEGQVSVFWAGKGPCYRCLYPEPPEAGLVPSCAEGGVLGVLPGLMGIIQATEVQKLVLGIGEPLIGRLLLVEALGMRFREIRVAANAACVRCGSESGQASALENLSGTCDPSSSARPLSNPSGKEPHAFSIGVAELKQRLSEPDPPLVFDVREEQEFGGGSLPLARNAPLGNLIERLAGIPRETEIVLYCKTGGRSARGARLLWENGFSRVRSLAGGIDLWLGSEPGNRS